MIVYGASPTSDVGERQGQPSKDLELMKRRSVDRALAAREPFHVWNAFIDLLTMEEYADLTARQRQAHLVFWYDSEVGNGGHDQYFGNRGREQVGETVAALEALGLPQQAEVLRQAAAREAEGREGLYASDEAYASCTPNTVEGLEKHLAAHQGEYVELV